MATPQSLHFIGYAKDVRTNTNVAYAQIKISEYMALVGIDFDRFEIQRKREKHNAYLRMKSDIINGALLPTITLAINPQVADKYIELAENKNSDGLLDLLHDPNEIYILDGLQRTYIINDIQEDGLSFSNEQNLLLEFWFGSDVKHLIYRLIVLNAGQKPMSMRHQVELLFMTMQEKLENDIPGLVIYSERSQERRSGPRKLPFDRLVTAYYSFLTKSPETKKDNIVVQQMSDQKIFDSNEDELAVSFRTFTNLLLQYCRLDDEAYRIYAIASPIDQLPNGSTVSASQIITKNWLAEENTINSFFAAAGSFAQSSANRLDRVIRSIDYLINSLKDPIVGDDPFYLNEFARIRGGINPRKVNVGYEVRKILTDGFKEYFRDEGMTNLGDCWSISAS